MKLKNILSASALLLTLTGRVDAGGGIGGSGPPAKEALEQLLMSKEIGAAAGLFQTEIGEIVAPPPQFANQLSCKSFHPLGRS